MTLSEDDYTYEKEVELHDDLIRKNVRMSILDEDRPSVSATMTVYAPKVFRGLQ